MIQSNLTYDQMQEHINLLCELSELYKELDKLRAENKLLIDLINVEEL